MQKNTYDTQYCVMLRLLSRSPVVFGFNERSSAQAFICVTRLTSLLVIVVPIFKLLILLANDLVFTPSSPLLLLFAT